MERRPVNSSAFCILFIIGLVGFLFLPAVNGQENFDPPEIKGPDSMVYQGLRIEITGIQRSTEFQSYLENTKRPRGNRMTAGEGSEIAIVKLHTTRLDERPGIRVYYLYLIDDAGISYQCATTTFSIGTATESRFDPKEHDYELPVEIPIGTKISAVQLHQPINRDTQPYIVIQKITFDVSNK